MGSLIILFPGLFRFLFFWMELDENEIYSGEEKVNEMLIYSE